jgi:hypothetical protein
MKIHCATILFLAAVLSFGCLSETEQAADPPGEANVTSTMARTVLRTAEPAVLRLEPTVDIDGTTRSLTVILTNAQPVAGFQFQISGAAVNDADGGRAAVDFQVFTHENGMVLGYQPEVRTIPAGSGPLTSLTITPITGATEVCITEPILSDDRGQAISIDGSTGHCVPLD